MAKRKRKPRGATEPGTNIATGTGDWRTSTRLQAFIADLHNHGNIDRACHTAKITRIRVWQLRQESPDFVAAFDEARRCGLESLKDEAHRRAYQGVFKPVYHKGEHCGLVREFSDSLLMFLIKQQDPSYRENFQVDIGNAGGRPFVFQMQLHPAAVEQKK